MLTCLLKHFFSSRRSSDLTCSDGASMNDPSPSCHLKLTVTGTGSLPLLVALTEPISSSRFPPRSQLARTCTPLDSDHGADAPAGSSSDTADAVSAGSPPTE